MSTQNPRVQSPAPPERNATVLPGAPDFVELPDAPTRSTTTMGHEMLPWWLYVLCGLALFLAGSSFTGFGTLGPYDQGPGSPLTADEGPPVPVKPMTAMELGESVYKGNCANCHQASGVGQPGSYPPLGGSEYVNGDVTTLTFIMLHGLQGPVTVEGGQYGSQQMPGWATTLNPEKIAAVMTYIRGSWGNKSPEVKADEVSAALVKTAAQNDAYTIDTLKKAAAQK